MLARSLSASAVNAVDDEPLSHIDDASLQLSDIEGITAWGNHGGTMYADTSRATIRGKPLRDLIADNELWEKEYVELVERRGWVLMELRGGVSSALSVARASVVVARWLFQGSQVPSPCMGEV